MFSFFNDIFGGPGLNEKTSLLDQSGPFKVSVAYCSIPVEAINTKGTRVSISAVSIKSAFEEHEKVKLYPNLDAVKKAPVPESVTIIPRDIQVICEVKTMHQNAFFQFNKTDKQTIEQSPVNLKLIQATVNTVPKVKPAFNIKVGQTFSYKTSTQPKNTTIPNRVIHGNTRF